MLLSCSDEGGGKRWLYHFGGGGCRLFWWKTCNYNFVQCFLSASHFGLGGLHHRAKIRGHFLQKWKIPTYLLTGNVKTERERSIITQMY